MSANEKKHSKITGFGEARHQLKLRDRALHKIKNVNYTGIRFEDGQWKLHIGVVKKLPEHDKLLNPDINFSGLPLIFDEVGEIKALAASRTIKYRPAPPGISIGHKDITAGTLGVTCFKDGVKYILSNNHVLANMNAGAIGDAILQPGAYDGGTNPADKIGTLAAFVPIVFNDQNQPNHVDCALCLPTNAGDLLDEILEFGYPVGSKEATVGMNVIKSGRTTGVNTGTITEFSGLIAIGYGAPGTAYYDDQIITSCMSAGGDSGSCVLDTLDNKAVGLLFAGSDVISIHCRMTEVVAALGIAIFQPDCALGTTQDATTDPMAGTITLNGSVVYVYGGNPHRYFEWGVTSGVYIHEEDCGIDGIGAFSKTITVDVGSYYYRVKVVDGANINYGMGKVVVLAPPPPIVATQEATIFPAVGQITLNGDVAYVRDGDLHRYFEWGTTPSVYTHEEDCGMGGVGAFHRTITIDADSYYRFPFVAYYRAKVTDGAGTDYGTEKSATLPASHPLWGGVSYTDIVGKLVDVGPVLCSGGGGWGLGAYGWSSYPSKNRMILMDDGLLHVFDQWSINGDLRDNDYGMRIRDYYAKPGEALNESAWHFHESLAIAAWTAAYGLTCAKLDQKHLWLSMVDWNMGNTSSYGYYSRITVDAGGGVPVHMNLPGSSAEARDTTGFGYPVVINGQRYHVFRGGPDSGAWSHGYGYLKVDDTGLTIGGVYVYTGSDNPYTGGGSSGYTVNLISAWANGSSIEFAVWDQDVSGLMHIYRVTDPSSSGTWSIVGTVQVTPGSGIDSIRMMDDGYLCMVLSVGGDKHLLWWKDGVFEEEYIGIQTSTDDVDFYSGGIFGGPVVGTLTLYAGGRKNAKGVFGFRYAQMNNSARLHLGIKIVSLAVPCITKTLYHTVLIGGGGGYALVNPSVLNINGVYYFLFGRATGGSYYTDCFVREGVQNNAVWYGE